MWFTFWKIDKTFYIVVSFWNVCPVHLEMSSTSWKKRKILIFVREKKNCLEMLENFNMDSFKSKSFFWYFNTSKVLTLIHYQGFWLVKIACLCHACCVGKIEPPHDKANKMACTPSEDSDQPGHPPSLIRVFAVRMKKAWVLSYPLSASEDSDQTGRMPRLIWVFAGHTILLVLPCGSSNGDFLWCLYFYVGMF